MKKNKKTRDPGINIAHLFHRGKSVTENEKMKSFWNLKIIRAKPFFPHLLLSHEHG